MAITRLKKRETSQTTTSYSRICTQVSGAQGFGFTTYYNSWTVDYTYPVTNVYISNVGGAYAAQPTFEINGTRVTYTCSSTDSFNPVTFTATVVVAGGTEEVEITDIQATSGREINYVKTSSEVYLWARPTSIDLQFPWDAISTWSLARLAGSKHPNATQGPVWHNGTKTTSGTNTYSFSNVYYGDKLKFSYVAKPGAVLGLANNYEFTVDPTFSVSNIQVESSDLPDPTAELSSQWDFKEGTWSTVKDTSTRSEFKLKVTKPDSVKPLAVNVYVSIVDAEAFYRHNLNLITYEDSLIPVYCGSTLLPQYTRTLIGTIAAGTASKEFTLKVVDSSYNYCWPKGIKLSVQLELNSTDHYFTSDTRYVTVSKGTFTSTSGGGGGGTGGGGGMGGTGYGSKW